MTNDLQVGVVKIKQFLAAPAGSAFAIWPLGLVDGQIAMSLGIHNDKVFFYLSMFDLLQNRHLEAHQVVEFIEKIKGLSLAQITAHQNNYHPAFGEENYGEKVSIALDSSDNRSRVSFSVKHYYDDSLFYMYNPSDMEAIAAASCFAQR